MVSRLPAVDQLAPKVLKLTVIHEWLVLGRTIVVRQEDFLLHLFFPGVFQFRH